MENDQSSEEETVYEPVTTSNNPTERILARRNRIQRRVEALQKQREQLEQAGEYASIRSELVKTPIELQVAKSLELLEHLFLEGEEYITNVRVATEAREADRREKDGIDKESLFKNLEDEALEATNQFNEIANKWVEVLKYNDPLHISDEILNQKEKCDKLFKQKDGIILELKAKLRTAEIHFGIDQRKQMEDVNTLSHRIEKQMNAMRKSFRQELNMIEDVINSERELLIETNNKLWEELYKKRDQEEQNNAERRSDDYWKFANDLTQLHKDFNELYRTTTIQLENDRDELQREFERIKSDSIMNSEKLDYNYQILKKREDENMIIRSQQKRRINKLQDVVNSLRKKNQEYHKKTSQQVEKLVDEVNKLNQSILDIEKKADHIAKVNNLKFKQVWQMNKDRALELLEKILNLDRILYEQHLGLPWKAPFNLSPKLLCDSKTNLMKETKSEKKVKRYSYFETSSVDEGNENHKKIINHILNLILDKTDFLVEEKLKEILQPYVQEEQNLIKIDNIFSALEVTERKDIDHLFEFFLPYMFCPICNTAPSETPSVDDESVVHVHDIALSVNETVSQQVDEDVNESLNAAIHIIDDTDASKLELGTSAVVVFEKNLKGECRGFDMSTILPEGGGHTLSVHNLTSKLPCQYHHPLVMSSVYVLKALKEFLSSYHATKPSMPSMDSRLIHERVTFSRNYDVSRIKEYWKNLSSMFPEENIQTWDSLLAGLKKYHEILRARRTVSEEVLNLRELNLELRKIFANYIDKKDIPY